MKTNPNSPMYPLPLAANGTIMPENEFIDEYYAVGLKKREHFAAMAMQGLLAAGAHYSTLSEKAVVIADALIIELNK